MESYFEEETVRTPRIEGSVDTGLMRIEGRSLPEDARQFYRPFREWLNELLNSNIKSVKAEFSLEYFNTSTSKVLVDLMLFLDSFSDRKKIEIVWEYQKDDPEMAEVGKDFQAMLGNILKLESKTI